MQLSVSSRTEAQKKTHTFQHVRENASFLEVVGMLHDARIAAEAIEQVFQTAENEAKCSKVKQTRSSQCRDMPRITQVKSRY